MYTLPPVAITYSTVKNVDNLLCDDEANASGNANANALLYEHYLELYNKTKLKRMKQMNGVNNITQNNAQNSDSNSDSDSDPKPKTKTADSALIPNIYDIFEHHYLRLSNTSKEYLDKHKLWHPQFKYSKLPNIDQKNFSTLNSTQNGGQNHFKSYSHFPKVLGESPLPSLIHHTSTSVDGSVFVLGGVVNLMDDAKDVMLNDLYQIETNLELPFPMNRKLLNNPALVPNKHLFKIAADTNHHSKPEVTGDIPPPLMCMSSSRITDRYIFFYGGFEFDEDVDLKGNKFIIKRNIVLNNTGYILDTFTLSFQKITLQEQPTTFTLEGSVTIPRFSHSSSSILTQNKSSPAPVYILGGFIKNEKTNKFETTNDLWKIEFLVTSKGRNHYVRFGETALATAVQKSSDNFIPPRAFHIAEIADAHQVSSKSKQSYPFKTKPSFSSEESRKRGESVSSIGKISNFSHPNSSNYRLIVHGGISGRKFLGDVWAFDFDQERWSQFNTFYINDNQDSEENDISDGDRRLCQVKKAGHGSVLADRYLVLVGGSNPFEDEIPDPDDEYESPKITDISGFEAVNQIDQTDSHHKLFVFDFSTQLWTTLRCFHRGENNSSDNIEIKGVHTFGSSVTSCNQQTFVIGGEFFRKDSDHLHGDVQLLFNGVVTIEFPLGGFINSSLRKN